MHAHNLNAHHHDHPSTVHHRRNETKKKHKRPATPFSCVIQWFGKVTCCLQRVTIYERRITILTTPRLRRVFYVSISYMFRTTKMESIVLGWKKRKKNKLGVNLLPSKMLETTGRHVERYKKVKYTVSSSAGQLAMHLLSEFVYRNVKNSTLNPLASRKPWDKSFGVK